MPLPDLGVEVKNDAAHPVPVTVQNPSAISVITQNKEQQLDVLLFKEGFNLQASFGNTVVYAAGATIGEIRPVYAGENAFIRTIILTSSKYSRIAIRIGRFQATGVNSPIPFDIFNGFVGPDNPITFQLNKFYGSYKYLSFLFDSDVSTPEISANLGQLVTVSASIIGERICSDMDFHADYRVWAIGDSIWRNSNVNNLNLLAGETWLFKLKDKINSGLLSVNKRARIVTSAIQGLTTTNFERIRLNGELNVENPTIILYGLCVNDAIDGTSGFSDEAYSNFVKFINYKKLNYPRSVLIMVGGTPLQNNTAEANLAIIRTRMQQSVTEAADPLIFYVSQSATFNRTISANYSTTDVSGSGVHPIGDARFESMAQNIYDSINTNNILQKISI